MKLASNCWGAACILQRYIKMKICAKKICFILPFLSFICKMVLFCFGGGRADYVGNQQVFIYLFIAVRQNFQLQVPRSGISMRNPLQLSLFFCRTAIIMNYELHNRRSSVPLDNTEQAGWKVRYRVCMMMWCDIVMRCSSMWLWVWRCCRAGRSTSYLPIHNWLCDKPVCHSKHTA